MTDQEGRTATSVLIVGMDPLPATILTSLLDSDPMIDMVGAKEAAASEDELTDAFTRRAIRSVLRRMAETAPDVIVLGAPDEISPELLDQLLETPVILVMDRGDALRRWEFRPREEKLVDVSPTEMLDLIHRSGDPLSTKED